jgi:hypothetical protein
VKRERESEGSLISPGIQIALISQLDFIAQIDIVLTSSAMCVSCDSPLLIAFTAASQSQLNSMFFPFHSWHQVVTM